MIGEIITVVFDYRISEDNSLAEIWARKNEDQRTFKNRFRFAQYPENMPFRDEIKIEIDKLNEYWAHPNINYSTQAISMQENEIRINYYDDNENLYYLSLFTFYQNCYRLLSIIRYSMRNRYSIFLSSTENDYVEIKAKLERIKDTYRYLTE